MHRTAPALAFLDGWIVLAGPFGEGLGYAPKWTAVTARTVAGSPKQTSHRLGSRTTHVPSASLPRRLDVRPGRCAGGTDYRLPDCVLKEFDARLKYKVAPVWLLSETTPAEAPVILSAPPAAEKV